MDLGEWLLLGGLSCCLLLLVDGYRRARRRREHVLSAATSSALPTRQIESRRAEPDRAPTIAEAPSAPSPAASPAPAGSSSSLESHAAATLIGSSMTVIGDIDCAEPIHIEGRLDGILAADEHHVVVGAQADVGPQLSAGTLHIAGHVSGEQRVRGTAMIVSGARVQGTLSAHRLQCDEGATLSGNINVGDHRLGDPRH